MHLRDRRDDRLTLTERCKRERINAIVMRTGARQIAGARCR
jgi:hypothetical protein